MSRVHSAKEGNLARFTHPSKFETPDDIYRFDAKFNNTAVKKKMQGRRVLFDVTQRELLNSFRL